MRRALGRMRKLTPEEAAQKLVQQAEKAAAKVARQAAIRAAKAKPKVTTTT